MKKALLGLLILAFVACYGVDQQKSSNKINALIKSGQDKHALVDLIKKHYQKFPKDSNNALYLYQLANLYQLEKNQIDSAKKYAQLVFTDFPNSISAPAAMLFFATLNSDFNERAHWYNQCHNKYTNTKSGENAILALAVDYENEGNTEKALENYGKYLATYPNGAFKEDVESSIKNINTPIEELVKQFEENMKKPQ